jgi:hypothetical protein
MKRIQFLLAAAVVFAVGSAFTSIKSTPENAQQSYPFIRVSGFNNSTNPLDYQYRPTWGCTVDVSYCSTKWSQNIAPAIGSNPTGTFLGVISTGKPIAQ